MIKLICDICGKEMSASKIQQLPADLNFCISSYGKVLDICEECRVSLNKWMTIRRRSSCGED